MKKFLCITHYMRPAPTVKTERKGWGEHAENWRVSEVPAIKNNLKNYDLRSSTVIIDLVNNKFVKNRNSTNNDTELLNHFVAKYASYINASFV